ncbi:MAG TPA: ATP-binding cassette domain-containing protein [Halanaerobiaceae bacterium]|jgi:energy-coupling factor transport system ATP-binding protein|nr:ATP-binding cassette domain-containing protein [Bacillota bacterium]HHU91564.1 ATP-binding cassette domain-containing protein [Halanaerobiaceae bacterium]HOA41220.1 ATP-binding cassette domain-containing protein [Halanaerobiales bacterium]HPZ63630.1 ATP-binding cassette domain-containing protein [Halanaerobiales bacterium]HQD04867.1 ATP-binding cassette domain-containing protein [Halanaerobiales bacterium]
MKTVLKVNNLSFTYNDSDKKALNNINLSVNKGEFFCIIGSNGSGKSTLCNILVGLIPHYISGQLEGDVFLGDLRLADSSMGEIVSKIGLVFQNPFNQLSYTASTVEEELAFGLGNLGIPREEMKRRIERVAKLMRIEEILHKSPLALSGGQVQRVALGSCIIMEPDIIVLDECTSQLDPLGSEEIFDIIKELNMSGITVILADHDMERVARTADRILVLDKGEQIALDTPEKIFSSVDTEKHKINMPDFTRIGFSLNEEKLYDGNIVVTEEAAISLVKEVLQ